MSYKPAPDVASKEKNEYIPSFITKKPFWVPEDDTTSAKDYLDHQRLQNKDSAEQSKWYDRGKKLGPAATKFRKGACENCGAMTHKTKDCLNRPRKAGAKWTGKNIQADEAVQEVRLGWDAKRDRWNGYDAAEYRNIVDEYEELERLKKKTKTDGLDSPIAPETAEGAGVEEARYAEESDMGRQQSTATRNLRLREDTAKYLLNLDLDSAKYDPKTRSMVDMGAQTDQAAALVAEDNFMRASGDAAEFEKAQKYAWESQERGDKSKAHIQANPTSGEYFRRKEAEFSIAKREAHRSRMLEKYGGDEHLKPAPLRDAAVLENEHYVEYDELGSVKGAPKSIAKSRYPEDVFHNNHATVWGSWWKDFQWGYACCHSLVKNSYCTGEEGREAFEEAESMRLGIALEAASPQIIAQCDPVGESETISKNSIQFAATLPNTERFAKKRTAEETKSGITEAEMESYRRSRAQTGDPMAAFLGRSNG
ncbi:MAG: mRNA splicing protein [Stictis urceolatum]|nr:mRNA splicing protein [Stictis urceolata]